ncbi:MAG: endonuclease [Bacteroidales bacterium]|nr:endonuclease [Bacteroidales bacterium]MBS3775831.1 endonuclease [Bacteroidales bacterium]
MKTNLYIWMVLFWINGFCLSSLFAQEQASSFDPEKSRTLRVMFYNVENAFDTVNAPTAGDDEFTPGGIRRWNWYKYRNKIDKMYKVIVAAGGWEPPGLVGFCEVESRKILEDLVHHTPFSKYQYKIIHNESPDFRGIDVAAIYREDKFQPAGFRYISVPLAKQFESTRDILYIKGIVPSSDTLHIFFNHWPSRWQGALHSRPKRIKAAQILRYHIDSLLRKNPEAFMVVAGDFNDTPESVSLVKYLKAENAQNSIKSDKLYNLSRHWEKLSYGSYKYQGVWEIFDQFIVSGNLLTPNSGLHTSPQNAHIMLTPFLVTEDEKYTGTKPFRTYSGYRYIGGFSDHLPIILDLHQHQPGGSRY